MKLNNHKILLLSISILASAYSVSALAADNKSSPVITYDYGLKSNASQQSNKSVDRRSTRSSTIEANLSDPKIEKSEVVNSFAKFTLVSVQANANQEIFESVFKAFKVESAILGKGIARLSIDDVAKSFEKYLQQDGYIYARVGVLTDVKENTAILSVQNPTFGEILIDRSSSNIKKSVDKRLWNFKDGDAFNIDPIKSGLEELVSYRSYRDSTIGAERIGNKVNLNINYVGKGLAYSMDFIPYDSRNPTVLSKASSKFIFHARGLLNANDVATVEYSAGVQQPVDFDGLYQARVRYGINAPNYLFNVGFQRFSVDALPVMILVGKNRGQYSAKATFETSQFSAAFGPKFNLGNQQTLTSSIRFEYSARKRTIGDAVLPLDNVNTLVTTSIAYVKKIGGSDSYGVSYQLTNGSNIFGRLGSVQLLNGGVIKRYPDPTIHRVRAYTSNDLFFKDRLFNNTLSVFAYSADRNPINQAFTSQQALTALLIEGSKGLRSRQGFRLENAFKYYIAGDKRKYIDYRVEYDKFINMENEIQGTRDTSLLWHEVSFNVDNYNGLLFNIGVGHALIKPVVEIDNLRATLSVGYRY